MLNLPELICYLNGKFVKESEAKFSWLDQIMRGVCVYEMARTYNHVPLFWKEHIDRLYRSLSYVHIDPGLTPEEMHALTLEVFKRNEKNLDPGDDFAISHWLSAGTKEHFFGPITHSPTILINCVYESPRYASDAKKYREGIHLVVGNHRQYPPESLSSQAKHCSRLNLYLADYEAKMVDPEAWVVVLDCRGFIAEGTGYNVLWVKDGRLLLPTPDNILAGITQSVVLRLAKELGIEVVRGNYTRYDLYTADEIFCTCNSPTIVPVSKFNERIMPKPILGPITKRLLSAFSELVGVDLIERVQHVISYAKAEAK